MTRKLVSFLALLLLAVALAGAPLRAASTLHVTDWAELLPKGLYDFIPQDGMTSDMWFDPEFQKKITEAERRIRPELNSRPISLPGYMVPLVYKGDDVYEFLLVPSAGQCIHVPPPPVNQTVFVKLEKPTPIRTYGMPVIVEGALSTATTETEYAESGYRIEASKVIDFDFDVWEARLEEIGVGY